MPFSPPSFRHRSSAGGETSVFAVGRRVYVACPAGGPARATVTDETGTKPLCSLSDGTEVQIVAWWPRGSGGTRYRVRCPPDNVEGWLPARNLRSTRVAAAPTPTTGVPPVPTGTRASGDTHRRFGQRSE